jgi:uncharacterized protein (TIGR03435 family)
MLVMTGAVDGDRWRSTNSTLRLLIRQAFGADYPMDGQIVGGPSWMDTDWFDVLANMAPGTTSTDMQAMVRSLLADRFKLRVHREMRELPVYALVLARPDGRLGPQLEHLSVDCDALRAARLKGEAPPMPRPTAVVDQLGLRLESRREQTAVLVIDGAEPPSDD